MKTVIFEYGKSVLTVTAVLLILGIFGFSLYGKQGVWSRIREQAAQEGAADRIRGRNDAYESFLKRQKPEIVYRGRTALAGVLVDWNEMFLATDADGKELELMNLKINGSDLNPDDYRFPKSGIYEIEVMTRDDYGLATRRSFQIPVRRLRPQEERGT